jgi:hypothetical protein
LEAIYAVFVGQAFPLSFDALGSEHAQETVAARMLHHFQDFHFAKEATRPLVIVEDVFEAFAGVLSL